MVTRIKISDKAVRFPRAISPDFEERRVIASSPWEFVSLWLKQSGQSKACVYWEQAKSFFDAAKNLPVQSAPLPLYYCFLNATKALLESRGITYNQYHGVSALDIRSGTNGRIRIDNEGLKIKSGGILPSLISYFGETETKSTYTLGEILSNMPFIHRAVALSYSRSELFLSIKNPRYVTDGSGVAWFRAEMSREHGHGQTLGTIPSRFTTQKVENSIRLESSNKFNWSGARRPTPSDIQELQDFHKRIRLDIAYIAGPTPLWYIKRNLTQYTMVDRYDTTLIFLAMHRFSEIARYKPVEFVHMLEGKSLSVNFTLDYRAF